MILTSSPQSVADSRNFSAHDHIPRLAECDRVVTYSECGYFCVAGYRNGDRAVHAHMSHADEFRSALDGQGYRLAGDVLRRLSDEERRAARLARGAKGDFWRQFKG